MEFTVMHYREEGPNDVEVEYEIDVEVSEYSPAVIHAPVERCHPAEGGEVEIVAIRRDGKDVLDEAQEKWSEKEFDLIREAAAEHAPDEAEADEAEAGERRWESREDR